MTTQTPTPQLRDTPSDPRRRERSSAVPIMIAAPLTALWTVCVGIAPVMTLALLVWVADSRTTHPTQSALRFSGEVWLMAHGTPAYAGGELLRVVPLAWTLFIVWQLWRAGVSTARATGVRHPRHCLTVSIAVAGCYGGVAGVIASVVRSSSVWTPVWMAVLITGVVAAVVCTCAVWVEAGVARRWWGQLPQFLRCGVLRGVRALLWNTGAAGVFVLVALVWNIGDVIHTATSSSPGIVGGVGVFLLSVAFLPTVVVWSVAYLSGAGFAVGVGTHVTPFSVDLGPLPAFPLMAGVPHSGGGVWIAVLAVPVVVGIVHGSVLARQMSHTRIWRRYSACGVAVLTAILGASLLGAASSQVLGGEYLAAVGPSIWKMSVGVMATLGVGMLLGVAGTQLFRREY